ncbi:MAG: hypothetical protein ACOC82_04580 [Candidatus Bipolaricaulota bacterium]
MFLEFSGNLDDGVVVVLEQISSLSCKVFLTVFEEYSGKVGFVVAAGIQQDNFGSVLVTYRFPLIPGRGLEKFAIVTKLNDYVGAYPELSQPGNYERTVVDVFDYRQGLLLEVVFCSSVGCHMVGE